MLGLLDKLCPDAGGFTQASGEVQPGTPGFCDDIEEPNYIPSLSISCPGKTRPGPYATSKHPISCTCICDAISGWSNYRIEPFEIPIGIWGDEVIRPKGGRAKPHRWPDLDIDIQIGEEQDEGYTGTGDPDFGRPGKVRGPKFILLGHELCGHAVPGDYDYDRNKPIDVENDIRDEHGVPGHRDGKDHTDPRRF
jgi:hypothetical protein